MAKVKNRAKSATGTRAWPRRSPSATPRAQDPLEPQNSADLPPAKDPNCARQDDGMCRTPDFGTQVP
jgi:hypothetical protein